MAQATSAPAMEAKLSAAIQRGTLPQRYRTSVGQFIRAPGGEMVRLQGADNRLTAAGRIYWRLRGFPAPSLYNYNQALLNDKWVQAYDGSRIKVRERGADGEWRITNAGEGYFRYNRTEYLPRAPYLMYKDERYPPNRLGRRAMVHAHA